MEAWSSSRLETFIVTCISKPIYRFKYHVLTAFVCILNILISPLLQVGYSLFVKSLDELNLASPARQYTSAGGKGLRTIGACGLKPYKETQMVTSW